MALAKQTHALFLISAYIIFATCTDAKHVLKHAKPSNKLLTSTKHSQLSSPCEGTTLPPVEPPSPRGKAEVANMVSKQMQGVQKKIDEFNASLKERLNDPTSPPRARECVSECDEVFESAIDDIKKALSSLKSLNLIKANFDVSAIATNVDTCNDCFVDIGNGGDPEVKQLSDWVQKITGDALEALQKAA